LPFYERYHNSLPAAEHDVLLCLCTQPEPAPFVKAPHVPTDAFHKFGANPLGVLRKLPVTEQRRAPKCRRSETPGTSRRTFVSNSWRVRQAAIAARRIAKKPGFSAEISRFDVDQATNGYVCVRRRKCSARARV